LATAAAVVVYGLSSSDEPKGAAVTLPDTPTPLPAASVLVAKQDIAAATRLTADLVEVREVPAELRHARALTEPDQAIGKMAAVPLVQGEQILDSRVTEAHVAATDTFAGTVPVGLRAISVAYDEVIGTGALIQPGDHVDVIAFFELDVDDFSIDADEASEDEESATEEADADTDSEDDEPDYKQYVTTYIVQNVEVLAVSQAITPDQAGVAGQGAMPTPTPESSGEADSDSDEDLAPKARPTAKSVTLAVTPEQAQRLLLASQTVTRPHSKDQNTNASLRLVLRAPGDDTIADLPPAQLGTIPVGDLLGDVNRPMVPSDVVITHAEFTERVLPSGNVLEFKATVKNVSDRTIESGVEAPPEFEYAEGVAYDALGYFPERGTYRIALNVAGAFPNQFPYRWGLGRDLEPGESVDVVGSVRLTGETPATRYWLGIIREPDMVTQDGVNVSDITVIRSESGTVGPRTAELRANPTTSAEVVTQLTRGDELEILDARNAWFLVRAGDSEGWIAAESVKVPPLGSTDDSAAVRPDEAQ
jgi:Flp pilus assembly protein CpaB